MSKSKKTPDDFFAAYAPPLDDQWFSIGYACMFFDINPNQLDLLMQNSDVRFRRIVDGVMYLDGAAMQKLTAAFNEISTEINSAQQSVECN